ncbi:MAG: MarR family winged helix-turn-helix transcriptional regulator [Paracoccus sp. (in: a-proteobacteria)]|jgi:DNA-binding MarR family transcriptional regulator
MTDADRTAAAQALTDLILAVFRANNQVQTWGDRLVADLGLTSARWQVLGAIVAAGRPQPVAWLARDLGGNRQNVQRIVNDLEKSGWVEFQPNPHHRRAQLVVLTGAGQQVFDAATALYNPRVNALAEALPLAEIEAANRVVTALKDRLEALAGGDGGA